MASLFLFSFSPTIHSDFPSSSDFYPSTQFSYSTSTSACKFHGVGIASGRRRRRSVRRFLVRSTHSNARILKPKRRSRFGQNLSPFDSDDDGEDVDDLSSDEDDDEDDDDTWLYNGNVSDVEYDTKRKRAKLQNRTRNSNSQRDNLRHPRESRGIRSSNRFDLQDITNDTENQDDTIEEEAGSTNVDKQGKLMTKKAIENRFPRLAEEIELDKKWYPLLDYLTTFGLKESHFLQMYERRMPSLQINVNSAQERLEYLLSVGVKQRDVRRILMRQPQILEYTVENNLKSHVAFLLSLGIPNSRVGQIIAAAPSLFSYSVENSLKPTVRYLVEEVGIKEKDLGKVVQLSPQILVQRIDVSWNTRYMFLSKEIGAPRDNVVKMVTKHPQLLHYSIDDGLLPRINFLRSIGMRNSEILKVITSLTQVFSLSLEDNLKPKYMYLINELRNEVKSLTKYPMYLSLSLDQRIRPRHRFLVSLKKAPKGPFPLSSFVPTDECFCQQWAETSLDKYLEFRKRLLLKEFAQKYERRR
ncbi:transcription termination factor MTERF9, chloroplastic [Cucurbita maxima]|uniref:Transcription termination factor MTERF9, chloroplastic n=1 Tax=Cucurbita maxima TaxID=3661 RepID=A0A6J1IJ03_CUCMA|nr:transcription termination factor MTERF9, chloroplastic [Cucurbita maxima]